MQRLLLCCTLLLCKLCWSGLAQNIKQNQIVRALLTETLTPQSNHSCSASVDRASKLNDFHFRGTALGGWLVLEPWITPSLFYQFLGSSAKWGADAAEHVAIDSMTFCTSLGKTEANRQLRQHWKTWVTEEQISNLARIGLKHLRLPVADWMYIPYEPYIGCWDGALEEVDRVLDLCAKYGLEVIIDLHAVRGSQNGMDNSGDTDRYTWKIVNATNTTEQTLYYDHWDIQGADWVGEYNTTSRLYNYVNHTHLLETLSVIDVMINAYKDNAVVIGIEPVNEPWQHTPMDVLQEFYWRAYLLVQEQAPYWITLMHDSFRLSSLYWGNVNQTHHAHGGSGFMENCDKYAVDSHIYQAWAADWPAVWFEERVCQDSFNLQYMESLGVPVVVGEWSLATNNCAMWLNGLNDNVPSYPKVECARVTCPSSYLNDENYTQPGTPLDPTKPAQDPFGTGGPSYVEYGTCPVDRPFPHNDTEVMRTLSYTMLHTYDQYTHGQFFWNFRTELPESRWNYQTAVAMGWIPSEWESSETQTEIADVCIQILADMPKVEPPSTLSDDDDRHSLMLLEYRISAGLIFLLIVGTMYFIVQALLGRYQHWFDGYQTIGDDSPSADGAASPPIVLYPNNQRAPVSTVALSNRNSSNSGSVEMTRSGGRPGTTLDGTSHIVYPTRGNANHISPYQAAIIIPRQQLQPEA